MIRPQIEYTSVVWDPYYNSHIQQLEKVAAKEVCGSVDF